MNKQGPRLTGEERRDLMARLLSASYGELPAIAAEFGVTHQLLTNYRRKKLAAPPLSGDRRAWVASLRDQHGPRNTRRPSRGRVPRVVGRVAPIRDGSWWTARELANIQSYDGLVYGAGRADVMTAAKGGDSGAAAVLRWGRF